MEWLAIIGTLAVLYAFHRWGQYLIDPAKRTRDHVAGCAECHERILRMTPPEDGERLCAVGRDLMERYGAWN